MIDLNTIDHIYLVAGYTDLRKAADGCSAIVQYDLKMNPFSKDIFLFCNRAKNTIQIIEWDKNGFWLHKKKLIGKDRYRWPKVPEEIRKYLPYSDDLPSYTKMLSNKEMKQILTEK